jgi:hypothetical protein
VIRPQPRVLLNVRSAVAGDIPFIDQLQKMHGHMVGWMPGKQLEAYVSGGHVLIAEDQARASIGYCIARDQYMKRDDVGIVYHLNVLPLKQRNLIGASLIKAVFDRAAYGCKLFSCWCAQDIQANWFWESIGFVPLAFRTGSRAKQRIHIFWQRRVRDGDDVTPFWFPSQTTGGAVAEDRIVLPIPMGTHWRDAKPLILPIVPPEVPAAPLTLPGGAPVRGRPEQPKVTTAHRMAIIRSESKHLKGLPRGKAAIVSSGGIRYIERGDYEPEPEQPKPKKERKPRVKNDPKFIAAARELRDRFLEQINSPGNDRMLPPACGKYDVSKQLEAAPTALKQTPLLKAA